MQRQRIAAAWTLVSSWLGAVVTVLGIVALASNPAPLMPILQLWHTLCNWFPALVPLTRRVPSLSLALLLGLGSLALLASSVVTTTRLVRSLCFDRSLRRQARPAPPRLKRLAADLGVAHRLLYLPRPELVACCVGFLRPRIVVTAGLLAHLTDAELTAVLAHERHHLRRRDPIRYLLLHAVTAAAFMFPLAAAIRQRREAQIELAADRAALAVAPRSALAGALWTVVTHGMTPVAGTVGLSATEVRIAALAGHLVLPPLPARAVWASVALVGFLIVVTGELAQATNLITIACARCVKPA